MTSLPVICDQSQSVGEQAPNPWNETVVGLSFVMTSFVIPPVFVSLLTQVPVKSAMTAPTGKVAVAVGVEVLVGIGVTVAVWVGVKESTGVSEMVGVKDGTAVVGTAMS